MIDPASLYIIAGLFVVILVEFFYLQWALGEEKKEKKELLVQMQAQNRALISKNANDYVMTTAIDKTMADEKAPLNPEDEMIDETQLGDDEWFKRMGIKDPQPAN